jgi:hypothetical protein
MPRIRSVKPEFFTDADLCALPPLHRLLFQGLWCWADRDGVVEDKPRELKAKILPYDDCDADAMLWDLHEGDFVTRYSNGGRRFLQVPRLGEHQKFHRDEKPLGLPKPEDTGSEVLDRATAPRPSGSRRAAALRVPECHSTSSSVTPSATPEPESATPPAESGTTRAAPVNGGCERTSENGERTSENGGRVTLAPPAPPGQLRENLEAVFKAARGQAYRWRHVDEARLAEVMGAPQEEILRRWTVALKRTFFPRCDTVKDLVEHWNSYATDQPKDVRKGHLRAEDMQHSDAVGEVKF